MEEIPLVGSALGGKIGRSIRFDTQDFSVYVKDIAPADRESIDEMELKHQLRSMGQHVALQPKVEIW